MVAIRLDDLKSRADEVLRQLQETGEPVPIVDGDRVVAKLVPADEDIGRIKDEQTRAALAELDRLGEEIAASVPPGTTLQDVLRDMRRDLRWRTRCSMRASGSATCFRWTRCTLRPAPG